MNDPNELKRDSSAADEEVGHLDDAIIGRAFRWSTVAFLTLAILGGIALWYVQRKKAPPTAKLTPLTAPVSASAGAAEIPEVKFRDITAQAGITFIHTNGAYGDKLLPETMGGGVAFFDYDNDGDQDLLFVNCSYWQWRTPPKEKPPVMALYRNDGKGHFEDVTTASGLAASFYGMGVAAGDYDNDGWVDLFLTGVGGSRLFRNLQGSTFSDVTAQLGLAGATSEWSTACAWLDFNNDGRLDLFVGNYVKWSKEIDFTVNYSIDGVHRAYGPPMNFQGTFPYLYRNEGNAGFREVAQKAGLHVINPNTKVAVAKTLGVAPVDLNRDGWIDLVLANDTVQNFVFSNRQNETFQEIGALSGIAFDNNGNTRGAMGIDSAQYRNDGALGIGIGNFANEMTALYVSRPGSMFFSDEALPEGVGAPSRLALKFGLFFFDYDLDGREDFLTANGHVEEEISKLQASQRYAQPAQLFWNCGASNSASFRVVPVEKAGRDLFRPIVGRGSAYADIDGDGDLDMVLTQLNGPPLLLRNDQALGHHRLRLKLIGTKCNRDAIGAWITVTVGSRRLARQVMPTRSYLSQSELPVTIGLGSSTRFDAIEVIWPDGERQIIHEARLDGTTVIEQPR